MKSTEEVRAEGTTGCLSQAGSCPWGTYPAHASGFAQCIQKLSSYSGERLELSNRIVSCLLLKGLCIPLSINLFMALG